jgi:CheY-like chemotaxis protein
MSREILAAVGDMFFASKIKGTAEQINVAVKFVRNTEALLAQARNAPALIVLDLNNTRFDPIEAIEQLKADESLRKIPIVGFLSHVQVDLFKKAESAGCDQILPRSKFTEHLPEILSGESF